MLISVLKNFLLLGALNLVHFAGVARSSVAMKHLYEDLFTDYNRLILPVANNRSKVRVTMGLKLGQILDLNLKQQILSTNVWVEQTWHDYKLEWDPNQYEGIDMIHVPAENIWIPDIVLFNNADGNYELTLVAKARIFSNGTVVWKPPTMFRSTCEIDVEYFPFDIQTCFLRFGSWTYAGDELELQHVGNRRKVDIGIDLSQFYKNVEWDIIDVPAYYNEVYYECCTEPFPDITFKIVIRRKMLFYLVNLILPVVLMTFMTVSVFYLPSDSNEKVTLSISILTSLIVFFLLMLEIIPASSLAVPLFGKYLLFTLVLVSLSACVSVYVLNIHHRAPAIHSMSPRMREIFLKKLPRLLHLDRPDPRERSSLNRFRQKKIEQLRNSNKVYDVAQPLAASLNLIETLHKSYDFNPKDDDCLLDDEEGRYFRRYVDNYINRMKITTSSCKCDARDIKLNACCEHNKCCSRANQPLSKRSSFRNHQSSSSCCAGGTNLDWTESSADMLCPLVTSNKFASLNNDSPAREEDNFCSSHTRNYTMGESVRKNITSCTRCPIRCTGILNDDTLDMTFDYEEQDNNNNSDGFLAPSGRYSAGGLHKQITPEDLPSPPPPPQLANLGDSMQTRSGRVSSCSKNLTLNSSDETSGAESVIDPNHGQLVDKLINSINMINNESDETTNTTSTLSEADKNYSNRLIKDYSDLNKGNQGRRKTIQYQPIAATSMDSPIVNNSLSGLKLNVNQQQQRFQHINVDNTVIEKCTCNDGQCDELNQNSTNCKHHYQATSYARDILAGTEIKQPSKLLLALRLPYDQMPAHVRAAIRSILFIADTIKNEDDENSAIEDWESISMVVDRLFLWIFMVLCTIGSIIILASAPSLYDQRASIDDKLRIDIPLSNCSANVNAH